jgi:glutamate formiminotransferase/formiminotetrahydrofolate cyclodeaminase
VKLLECVPNFSEGRDQSVIQAISQAVSSVSGVRLLNVDPGAATNRTVFTFAGEPEAVLEAAFQAVKVGSALIDLRHHHGEHARNGACDVCPLVPISGLTMDEVVVLAHRLGARLGSELGLSGYYYEAAATAPERRNLAVLREGEYEALPAKLQRPEWKPDFGPVAFNPKSGTTQVGARDFLVAYNINLNTRNAKIAKDIALDIREKGRLLRDAEGNRVPDGQGGWQRKAGLFSACKATGWYIDEYGCAQVTMNLTDINQAPMHEVFETVCELASERGVRVTGSELVGLVPLRVLTDAGRFFLKRQGACPAASDAELFHVTARTIGLNEYSCFDPEKRVIEYLLREPAPLVGLTVAGFADLLASDSPAPGGGSTAALVGALSAGLSSMVAGLSYTKKGFEDRRDRMEVLATEAQALKTWFLGAVDRDTKAFDAVLAAMRQPKKTDDEKAARKAAIEAASRLAILVPLEVLERTPAAAALALEVASTGLKASISDAGTAGLCAALTAKAARYNVMINLSGVSAEDERAGYRQRAAAALAKTLETCGRIEALLEETC